MADPMPIAPGAAFHHLGYACASIAREQPFFEALGYWQKGERFCDPAQGVTGCFLEGAGPRIELLENLVGSQTLTPWLNAGVRLYHFAYEVDDLDETLAWCRGQRAKVTVQPVPAVAFGGRRIAFVMFRQGVMLEFIERALQPGVLPSS